METLLIHSNISAKKSGAEYFIYLKLLLLFLFYNIPWNERRRPSGMQVWVPGASVGAAEGAGVDGPQSGGRGAGLGDRGVSGSGVGCRC
jgi:hypothetical protein